MNRNNVREQLIIDEGIVYEIYKDQNGYKTFGIGHLVTRRDPEWRYSEGDSVSTDRVWDAFEEDLDNAIADAKKLFKDFYSYPGEVQEVLVNMLFNLGYTELSRWPNFIAAIDDRDWRAAAYHGRDSIWWRRQVRTRAERLMSRLENMS